MFPYSNIGVSVDKIREASAEDPLLRLHREMLDQYTVIFKKASLDDRLACAESYSLAMDQLVAEWYKNSRYDDVVSFWETSYRDFPITSQNYNDMQPFIHQMNQAIGSLFRTGKRKEARQLLADALALCDIILAERPWDWYVKDAYSGLCFETAAILSELGDADEAQPLLKRAWIVRAKQFGKDDLLQRISQLPLKGKVPSGASTEDTKFFKRFVPDAPPEESTMKRFTIPCDFDGKKFPFYVYVMGGPWVMRSCMAQFRWVTECRGRTVPQELRDSFLRLNKIAADTEQGGFPWNFACTPWARNQSRLRNKRLARSWALSDKWHPATRWAGRASMVLSGVPSLRGGT